VNASVVLSLFSPFLRRVLVLGVLACLWPTPMVQAATVNEPEKPTATPAQLYDEVWGIVNGRFVDDAKNGQDWLIWRHRYDTVLKTPKQAYLAIDTMLASLDDRYTRFLDPDAFKDETDSIKATLFGIGIQIGVKENRLTVIAPIEDTPAAKAGLKSNDEILSINNHPTQGLSIKDGANLIRGEKGTPVTMVVRREGKELSFVMLRDEIKLKSITLKPPLANSSVPSQLGYIKLNSFLSTAAAKEFAEALKAQEDKLAYIVDLRSNPGGLLNNAVDIASFFIAQGPIVSTVDKFGYKQIQGATGQFITGKPLVVLIDEGSASASEILSGALKDHNRALLVGKRSFGKGLVQEITPLAERAGLNVTTQRYLTPNDIDINKKGIEPDVMVPMTEADFKAEKDPQLEKAVALLQERLHLPITPAPTAQAPATPSAPGTPSTTVKTP
jgi:carboxyl-terminal processing protease